MPTWSEVNNGLITIWWRGGSVVSADVVGAYQAIGARSLVDSKINRNAPGTNNITAGNNPAFAEATGWTFDGINDWLSAGIIPSDTYTILIRVLTSNGNRGLMGCRVVGSDFSIELIGGLGPFTGSLRARWGNGVITSAGLDYTSVSTHIFGLAGTIPYVDGVARPPVVGAWGGAPIAMYFGAHNTGGVATDFFNSQVHAIAVYNRILTAIEMATISTAMATLTVENTTKSLYVNFIEINPNTRNRPQSAHELWIATEAGIYISYNGGNSWTKVLLPDPSNAEFADAPPATVDELNFDWVGFSPLIGASEIYIRGTKTSTERIWIYKSTDSGITWTNRGVVVS